MQAVDGVVENKYYVPRLSLPAMPKTGKHPQGELVKLDAYKTIAAIPPADAHSRKRTGPDQWLRLLGRLQELLPMTRMPFLSSPATLGFFRSPRRALIGWVRRRGLVGVLRVLVQPALQLLDALRKTLHVPAHGLRSGQPVRLAEGTFHRHA
jgi:hypothetical protein